MSARLALQASQRASAPLEALCGRLADVTAELRAVERSIHYSVLAGRPASAALIDEARRALGAGLVAIAEFERAAAEPAP